MRRPRFVALALPLLALSAALGMGGCDDPFSTDSIVSQDSLSLAAPSSAGNDLVPSALDMTSNPPNATRWPDRLADANAWDLGVRQRNGQLVLLPVPATPVRLGAGLRVAEDQNFERVSRAPRSRNEYGDTAMVLQVGRVYQARSRQYADFGVVCVRYAKLVPVEIDQAQGTVSLRISTEALCNDPRLNP